MMASMPPTMRELRGPGFCVPSAFAVAKPEASAPATIAPAMTRSVRSRRTNTSMQARKIHAAMSHHQRIT